MKNKFPIESLGKLGVDIEGLDGAVVERKGYDSDISIFPDEEKTIIASISTSDIDADGDIVMPEGCDFNRYVKNPVVMFGHDYSKPPIGKATEVKILPNAIQAKIKFADTEMANDIWSLIRGGFLKAHSIGFVTKKALKAGSKEFVDYIKNKNMKVSDNCKRIISEFTLVEDSIVPIPSNPTALTEAISAKSINISLPTAKSIGIKINDVQPIESDEATGKSLQEEQPKTEQKLEPAKPVYTVIRNGPYVMSEDEKQNYRNCFIEELKNAKMGKII